MAVLTWPDQSASSGMDGGWSLQDARNRLGAVVDAALSNTPPEAMASRKAHSAIGVCCGSSPISSCITWVSRVLKRHRHGDGALHVVKAQDLAQGAGNDQLPFAAQGYDQSPSRVRRPALPAPALRAPGSRACLRQNQAGWRLVSMESPGSRRCLLVAGDRFNVPSGSWGPVLKRNAMSGPFRTDPPHPGPSSGGTSRRTAERTVGAFEAKTHLAALLDAVSAGEPITITRHGRAVARLVPPEGRPSTRVAETLEQLRVLCQGQTLGGLSVRQLRDEGRR